MQRGSQGYGGKSLFVLPKFIRDHLFSDLRPYSCISDPCRDYDKLFETREQWIGHEVQYHYQEWWCEGHHEDDLSPRAFASEKDLIDHILQNHPESSNIDFLVARARRPSLFPFKSCPFCSLDKESMAHELNISPDDSVEISNGLQKHIAAHLLSFSLLAFLEADGEDSNIESDAMNFENSSNRTFDSQESGTESIEEERIDYYPESQEPELEVEVKWEDVQNFIQEHCQMPDSPEEDPRLAAFVRQYLSI